MLSRTLQHLCHTTLREARYRRIRGLDAIRFEGKKAAAKTSGKNPAKLRFHFAKFFPVSTGETEKACRSLSAR
jgi:hypothetical protein